MLKTIIKITLLGILLIFSIKNSLYSQTRFLKIDKNPLNYNLNLNGDSIVQIFNLLKFKNFYIASGYLACNFDSILYKKDTTYVNFFVGAKHKINGIQIVSNDTNIIQRNITQKKTTIEIRNETAVSLLNNLENNGFPFAEIKSQTNVDSNEQINFTLNIDRGPFIRFDTLNIEGDNVLKKKFLAAYLGIQLNTPYSESNFRKTLVKLNQLPFIAVEKNPLIAFVDGGLAKPYFYLKKRKTDQINGIVGFAPNSGIGQKLVFTGEVLLKLNNLFKSAKGLELNWRSFNARSQEFKTRIKLPYLINKPFGLNYSLDLLKFDTLFTTINNRIDFQYFTSGLNGIKFFYSVSATNLNFVDTMQIKTSQNFPTINAIQNKNYGLEADFNFLDYILNPQKGWLIDAGFSIGTKEILRDNNISAIKLSNGKSLYDSIKLTNTQYNYRINIQKYFKTSTFTTLKINTLISQTIAPKIFFNELFREGGINSLKGFNEQSIFANNFNMLNIEFRYLISKNSHIGLFWNGAYIEDKSFGKTKATYDYPWGFGAGANIETGAGVLSLIYALGTQKNNPFDLRTGKIHFGISNYF